MTIHKQILYISSLITLRLYSADITQELQRIREAAQQTAAIEIQAIAGEIEKLGQDIATTEAQMATKKNEFQELEAQHRAGVAALVDQFTQRTQENLNTTTKLDQQLRFLKKDKKDKEAKKHSLERQAAELIAGYVVVDGSQQARPRTGSAPNARPAQAPYYKHPLFPSEIWDHLPESLQYYLGTTERP